MLGVLNAELGMDPQAKLARDMAFAAKDARVDAAYKRQKEEYRLSHADDPLVRYEIAAEERNRQIAQEWIAQRIAALHTSSRSGDQLELDLYHRANPICSWCDSHRVYA